MKRYFRFGLPLLGTQIASYLSSNGDSALIGLIAGPGVVGLYSRAVQSARMPLNQIRTPISQVAFSALSRQQDDTHLLTRFAERGQLLLAYPMALIAGGISAAASPLVAVMLGAGWEGVVPYLHFIAIGEGLNTMAMTGGWLYTVRGRTASLLKYTLFSAAIRTALLIAGLLALGPLGAAIAVAIAPLILWPISLTWAGRVAGIPTRNMLITSYRIFAVGLISSSTTAVVVWASAALTPVAGIALAVLTQLVVAGVLAVIPAIRRDYHSIWRAAMLARS
ncbi:oligosaccharide flippase family protein [Brachybacterium sp. Z12]|uniref:oligosaccharide flippase family protein n=1 Tax=Brachybacterium sp. Z12 TaxID=2759167 RepID=UPI001861D5B3|nr:oligosaccharide flippase family protein [Brachybacterium sp. Z12]QNN82678.1 oligosaccharide flippase family protein [Brachybacterium sp. Z12]